MKKVAFITTNEWVPWGGSEHLWAGAAGRFARQGVEVHVSVRKWDAPVRQIEELQSLGCRIHYRPFPPVLRERLRQRIYRDGYVNRHVSLASRSAELIVISQGNTIDALPWMEACRSEGLKYAVVSQCADEQWWPPDDGADRLAECFEQSSRAYFVSNANLALVQRQLSTSLSRGRVIRNPFNVRYEARPCWPSEPADELRLACVARLEAIQKGQDILMAVLSLPRWRARRVRLTFAGSGMHEKLLRRMAGRLDLTSAEFIGFIEDIEKFWGGYHALVLPSRFEGMPLALVEAMLCGRPAIVTDVGGNTELVRDGVNGFVAKAPTVEFLDEAMERAWGNRHRLREIGETAARDVRAWVGPDPTGDFVRELESLVDGKRDPSSGPEESRRDSG